MSEEPKGMILRTDGQGLGYGRFRQWLHHFVAGGVGMQPVLRQISLQKALVVDHGSEVVEVSQNISCTVVLQPAIQRQDFLRRTLGEEILRFRRVVVHWKY